MNETPLLTMQNISKRFPGVNALKNVSLEIARGEVHAYYDGSMDDRSALIEEQRILDKSQGFLKKRQVLAALMEMKIGGMKGAPIALPRGTQGNALKRLVSQTPRAAAKEQILEAKVEMRDRDRKSVV